LRARGQRRQAKRDHQTRNANRKRHGHAVVGNHTNMPARRSPSCNWRRSPR
jgi:hypothetical protein